MLEINRQTKTYHNNITIPKSNHKFVETGEINTSNTYIQYRSLSWLATGSSTVYSSGAPEFTPGF
jgi:hypothetical protein